jgi:cytochrome b561
MIRRRTSMIWFHWLTALLVALSFAIAWVRTDIEDLEFRAFWLDVHRTIGLLILGLTLIRLVARFRLGPLSRRSDLPPAIWLASRVTHLSIYVLLIAMPLLGWAQSSARARHFNLFGIPIPAIVGHDRDMAEVWGWWHEQVGWALFALILLHATAALFHHYVRRDELVRAMLPGYKPAIGRPEPIQPFDIAA